MPLSSILRDERSAAPAFLERWWGRPRTSVRRVERLDLRDLERLTEAWPSAVTFNRFLDPPEVEEGRLVFLTENQGVCTWAVEDPSNPHAEVALRRDEPGERWRVQGAPFFRWAIQLLVFEAGIGATYAADWLDAAPEEADAFTSRLTELPGAWSWPGDETRFYAGDELLCRRTTEMRHRGSVELSVAAQSADALGTLPAGFARL